MNELDLLPMELLPMELRQLSISQREVVLPMAAALKAIDLLESQGRQVLGWEGWVKDVHGRIGYGRAPQGTVSLEGLSVGDAAQLCRSSIALEAAQWTQDNPGTSGTLYFCITVGP